jgi:type VI secretion system protein ImpH
MAGHDRREGRPVEELLYGDASRFTFLQAVRLMEDIAHREGPGRRCAPGEAAHEENELVLFRHRVRLDHPPSDVEALDAACDGQPAVMTVNVMGLAGVLGPLPYPVTEAILDRMRYRTDDERDPRAHHGFADFLDIFNHRLISLLYRARKKYRPALDPNAPHDGRVARVLHALMGLGTPHLRGRVLGKQSRSRAAGPPQTDRPLLAYAGLIADRYRSPAGLERILEDHFGVKAEIVPFIGAWEELEDDDRTAIGAKSGRNQRLGDGALLGGRVWNQAAHFEVRVGPLDFSRFRAFLPGTKDAFDPLVSLIRFYAHDQLGFSIRLVIAGEQIPKLRLSRHHGAYLGHTTWLRGRRPPPPVDDQVRLVGQR